MGGAIGSINVIFANNPDRETAASLLKDIAGRHKSVAPRIVDKPLVLYGAGNLGRMAKDYLSHIGIPVLYIVDANASFCRDDPYWKGFDVVDPAEVPETDKKSSLLAVCISTAPYAPIFLQLADQGWNDVVPFYDITEAYRARHPLGNGWFAGNLTNKDIDEIESVLAQWDDDISRAHHLQFLAWRCLREEWIFDDAAVTTHDRYFIPRVCSLLHENESFLDVGAHFGEVSMRFAEHVQGTFREITAIEPDPANLAQLRHNFLNSFSSNQLTRIKVFDHVLDEHAGDSMFCEGFDYASQISSLGSRSVPVATLDSLAVYPSFIKLHLEGKEQAVLKGGQATLLHCRPIIAATAYHSRLDLWESFQWLMDALTDYRFLLRLHGWCGTGLVVYALPAERSICANKLR